MEDDSESLIWACAGDQGSVVFELGSSDRNLTSFCQSTGSGIKIVDCKLYRSLDVNYLLKDALAAQISRRPEIGDGLSEGICKAIAGVPQAGTVSMANFQTLLWP
ncbi:hypothetical protein VP1G_10967 [Cytospora mali]|uniref:Uncharacterized protein n=1 Tax=Cytospora mali TaxID=578113 RepID=A0A194V1Y8_CYTMA|nr:hypothetical protein VP1G_10967 [Valsa mali var. pyri (nom. inval.)]